MPAISKSSTDGNKINVSYPVKEVTQEVTAGEYMAVRALSDANKRMQAIKFIRVQYGLGLYEAKRVVDTIMDNPDILATKY